jgi:hypothetical protein
MNLAVALATYLVVQDCNDKRTVDSVLRGKYGESPQFHGIDQNGNLMEIYVSKDGKTYTIVVTTPNQWACMLNGGYEFHPMGQDA